MNINFKVIGLTRLGIKPKSTAPEADALITRYLYCKNSNQNNLTNCQNLTNLNSSYFSQFKNFIVHNFVISTNLNVYIFEKNPKVKNSVEFGEFSFTNLYTNMPCLVYFDSKNPLSLGFLPQIRHQYSRSPPAL